MYRCTYCTTTIPNGMFVHHRYLHNRIFFKYDMNVSFFTLKNLSGTILLPFLLNSVTIFQNSLRSEFHRECSCVLLQHYQVFKICYSLKRYISHFKLWFSLNPEGAISTWWPSRYSFRGCLLIGIHE
jgi:hypothetical protein